MISRSESPYITATLPLALGIAGAIVWIAGEALELLAPGSPLIQPVAGAGIVGTALLPFALLLGQGGRIITATFFGAFLMATGAFILGVMNLLGFAPSEMSASSSLPLYDVGGAAYILGSIAFAAGLVLNGRYNRILSSGIAVCAVVITLMFAAGLPQRLASVSNICLAAILITLAAGLLKEKRAKQTAGASVLD